ncbi:MAG TPA: hypothetical protein VGC42_31625 [Kofleriaceae bacterium]
MPATLRSLFRPGRLMFASLLLSAACSGSDAYAKRPAPAPPASQIALDIAPARVRAPYDVQILRENGEVLPTFNQRDRFYVEGNAGERYIVRVTNPTDHRIEAVVSVDGLDVIDGDNGDLRKRGYVVPAYGETRIEGFRTSQADVATFRFSSVAGSYAGQQGKARNVGVIAVALYEEQAVPEQQIIVGSAPPAPAPYDRRPDYSDDLSDAAPGRAAKAGQEASKKRAATAEASPAVRPAAPAPSPTGGAGAATMRRSPAKDDNYADGADDEYVPPATHGAQPHERLGLGTEFGEQRTSSVSYTQFVRAPGRPVAIAELRYNDVAGLIALGIRAQPLPDAGELMTRETADPFPGDRFAKPAR